METVPLVSINYRLTVLREEDALMVIRLRGDRLLLECCDFRCSDRLLSSAVKFESHVRQLSSAHHSLMANYNGSLGCVVKLGSKQTEHITASVANRSIDGLHESSAFNLLHLGGHWTVINHQIFRPKSHSEWGRSVQNLQHESAAQRS